MIYPWNSKIQEYIKNNEIKIIGFFNKISSDVSSSTGAFPMSAL